MVKSLSETLNTLAEKAQSDETIKIIADAVLKLGEIYIEFAKISQKINTDNNKT